MSVPALAAVAEHSAIKEMFESIRGIVQVRIEPVIQSLIIHYNNQILTSKHVLRYVSLFFQGFVESKVQTPGSTKKNSRRSS